jgi:replication initiation protein RepC
MDHVIDSQMALAVALEANNGRRRVLEGDLRARSLAKEFRGLPLGVKSPLQLHKAVKRVSRHIGLSPDARKILDALFDRTNENDWKPGQQPIVFPSNRTLLDALDIEESKSNYERVRRALKVLRQHSMIAFKDSPDRKRYGKRNVHGYLIFKETFGILLSPIAGLYADLVALHDRHTAVKNEHNNIRRSFSSAMSELLTSIEYFARHDHPVAMMRFQTFHDDIRERYKQSGRCWATKKALLAEITSINEQADGLMNALCETKAKRDDAVLTPIIGGGEPLLDSGALRTSNLSSNSISNELSDVKGNDFENGNGSDTRSSHKIVQSANAKLLASIKAKSELKAGLSDKEQSPATPKQLIALLPIKDADTLWPSMSRKSLAAGIDQIAVNNGIGRGTIDDLRMTMRPDSANCALVLMVVKGDLRDPKAYAGGLIRKYRAGTLNMRRSVWGRLKQMKLDRT